MEYLGLIWGIFFWGLMSGFFSFFFDWGAVSFELLVKNDIINVESAFSGCLLMFKLFIWDFIRYFIIIIIVCDFRLKWICFNRFGLILLDFNGIFGIHMGNLFLGIDVGKLFSSFCWFMCGFIRNPCEKWHYKFEKCIFG